VGELNSIVDKDIVSFEILRDSKIDIETLFKIKYDLNVKDLKEKDIKSLNAKDLINDLKN